MAGQRAAVAEAILFPPFTFLLTCNDVESSSESNAGLDDLSVSTFLSEFDDSVVPYNDGRKIIITISNLKMPITLPFPLTPIPLHTHTQFNLIQTLFDYRY